MPTILPNRVLTGLGAYKAQVDALEHLRFKLQLVTAKLKPFLLFNERAEGAYLAIIEIQSVIDRLEQGDFRWFWRDNRLHEGVEPLVDTDMTWIADFLVQYVLSDKKRQKHVVKDVRTRNP